MSAGVMVDGATLQRWLRDVRHGRRRPDTVVGQLRRLPFEPMGIARLDTHRRLRRGVPEVILGEGKTPAHLVRIIRRMLELGEPLLVTRLHPEVFAQIRPACPTLRYHPLARLAYQPPPSRRALRGLVAVVTGGTADVPVAEEAALTLQWLGSRAARVYDVGIAGVHRLLNAWPILQRARAIVAVAGMEGALPGLVAGLIRAPVIAVPTSVGYGASGGGMSALTTMLASCVPGIGVVNIDNGFGGAYLAHVINAAPR